MTLPVEFWAILAASAGVAACVLLHAGVSRLTGSFALALTISLGGGLAATLAAHLSCPALTGLPRTDALGFLAGDATLVVCGWYCFMNAIGGNESSIRIRILNELAANGGSMPEADLLARYDDRTMFDLRLRRMLISGIIVERGGVYHLASWPLGMLARIFWLLKRLILRADSEFR